MFKPKRPEFDRAMEPYVALARYSYWTYTLFQEKVAVPEGLPEEMLNRRAGAFVSLHIEDDLRGCIGTIEPVQANVAEEIISNAISA